MAIFTTYDNIQLEQHILENVRPSFVWYEMRKHPFNAYLRLVDRYHMAQDLVVTIETTPECCDEIYRTGKNFLLFCSMIFDYLTNNYQVIYESKLNIRLEFAGLPAMNQDSVPVQQLAHTS